MDTSDTDLRSVNVREMVEFLERRGSYQPNPSGGPARERRGLDEEGEAESGSCFGIDGEIGNDEEARYAPSPLDDGGHHFSAVDFEALFDEEARWHPELEEEPLVPPLSGEGNAHHEAEKELIRRARLLPGHHAGRWARVQRPLEAGAWYQPAHFFGRNMGIYIRQDAVMAYAQVLYWRLVSGGEPRGSVTQRRAFRIAFGMYFLHEAFHHKVESFGFRLHVSTGVGVYLPYKSLVYRETFGSDDCLEEALANADAFSRLLKSEKKWLAGLRPGSKKIVEQFVREVFDFSPPGYRRWGDFERPQSRRRGMRSLQCQIREHCLAPASSERDWVLAPHMLRQMLDITSMTVIEIPAGAQCRSPVLAPPAPPAKVRLVRRYLKQKGFERNSKGGKGSHEKYVRSGPPKKTIDVPTSKKTLSPGVFGEIARDLSLTPQQLYASL